MNAELNPFHACRNTNLGTVVSLRLAASHQIVLHKSNRKWELIAPLAFWNHTPIWIAFFKRIQIISGTLSIEEQGILEIPTIKITLEQDLSPVDFQKWYAKNIKQKRLYIEIDTFNNTTRAFGPMICTYKYIIETNGGQANRYELSFDPTTKTIAKLFNNKNKSNPQLIDNISIACHISDNNIETVDISCQLPITFYTSTSCS